MPSELPACAKCKIPTSERACRVEGGRGPAFCPTKKMPKIIEETRRLYAEPHILHFARQASIQEAECYINRDAEPHVLHPVKPRLQEICEFAQRMGYRRLGLAYCAGLQAEAAACATILEAHGFEVVSVVCKVGCTPKEVLGIAEYQKVRIGKFETMCNPIAQAEILNKAMTDFNIVLGLCVGHDSLFFMHAKAPTTVFAVKDRVLGHNPLAVVYTLGSYYQRFIKKP